MTPNDLIGTAGLYLYCPPAPPAPLAPTSRAEMDGARLGRGRRRLRHRRRLRRSSQRSRWRILRPRAGGGRLPRRDPQPARLADRASPGGSSAGRACSSASAPATWTRMINHYTANKKVRNDDAYSPGGRIGLRPDRATLPYCQRAREAFPGVPVIAGGVEASLRRLAHYDYWSDTVRRSILLDCQGRPRRLRHGRAADRRDRPAAGRRARRSRDLRDMRGRGVCPGGAARAARRAGDARSRSCCPAYEEVKADKHDVRRGDAAHPP